MPVFDPSVKPVPPSFSHLAQYARPNCTNGLVPVHPTTIG